MSRIGPAPTQDPPTCRVGSSLPPRVAVAHRRTGDDRCTRIEGQIDPIARSSRSQPMKRLPDSSDLVTMGRDSGDPGTCRRSGQWPDRPLASAVDGGRSLRRPRGWRAARIARSPIAEPAAKPSRRLDDFRGRSSSPGEKVVVQFRKPACPRRPVPASRSPERSREAGRSGRPGGWRHRRGLPGRSIWIPSSSTTRPRGPDQLGAVPDSSATRAGCSWSPGGTVATVAQGRRRRVCPQGLKADRAANYDGRRGWPGLGGRPVRPPARGRPDPISRRKDRSLEVNPEASLPPGRRHGILVAATAVAFADLPPGGLWRHPIHHARLLLGAPGCSTGCTSSSRSRRSGR